MGEIHGLVYLIAGAAVAIYSWFIDKTSDKNYIVFTVIGSFFVLVGIVKLLIKKSKTPRAPKQQRQVHHQMYQQPIQQFEHIVAGYCHQCGNAVRHFDNFCGRCGQRIFRRR